MLNSAIVAIEARDRQINLKQRFEMAGSIDESRFLQFFRNPLKKFSIRITRKVFTVPGMTSTQKELIKPSF